MLYEEMIRRADGELEVSMVDIEVKKAVVGVGEVEQSELVAAPFQAPAKAGDFIKQGDAVGLSVDEEHGWELAADEGGWAEELRSFWIWEAR